MAEACEPTRPSEDEDEEREPLLPRVAWAQPRRGAPGSAVRLQEDEGAAVLREPATDEPPGASGDRSISASLSTELDRTRSTGSGATHARARNLPLPASVSSHLSPCGRRTGTTKISLCRLPKRISLSGNRTLRETSPRNVT